MTEPTIKVNKLAYVRVEAPDLKAAEQFLQEFGLLEAERSNNAIYYRGTDAQAPCYVLTQGSGTVTAIAFEADSEADLVALSQIQGASAIEPLTEPGGGKVVRLTDPQNMTVEVVHGRTQFEALTAAPTHAFNTDGQQDRQGSLPGATFGPSHIRRLGHLVLESAHPADVFAWYNKHLGLTTSDAIHTPDGDTQMIFARLDRGAEYVDHHVVGFQFAMDEGARVQHVAFEVANVDDLMSGHDHLKNKKRKHIWGIGRHRLGGQIFDYWKSPMGVIHEHWTDTDLFNDQHTPEEHSIAKLRDYWGPEPGPSFVVSKWNLKTIRNIVRVLRARQAA